MEFTIEQTILRLPEWDKDRSELEKQLNNIRAGANGEKKVLETVHSVGLPEDCRIVENLNLPLFGGLQFQIDLALVSGSGILLLETKQIAGRLRFHQGPAELRKVSDSGKIIKTFDCPVSQLNDQIGNLSTWLALRRLNTNIQGLVVFANNPVIEEISPGMPVIRLRELRNKIRSHLKQPMLLKADHIESIACSLNFHSKPYLPFPYGEHRGLNSILLYRGQLCTYCGGRLKKQTERSWKCELCNVITYNPHLESLLAWFLIFSDTITPEQCLYLFGYQSHRSARKFILQLPVKRIGAGGHVAYQADYAAFIGSEIVHRIIENWRAVSAKRLNNRRV